jgi:hypothetical protein
VCCGLRRPQNCKSYEFDNTADIERKGEAGLVCRCIALLFKAEVEAHVSQPVLSLLASGSVASTERERLCRSMSRSPYKNC